MCSRALISRVPDRGGRRPRRHGHRLPGHPALARAPGRAEADRPRARRRRDFRERFQRESRMAAAIDHPNVIPVYEAGEEDGRLYLAMRWVAGTDLHQLIRADGPARPGAGGADRQPGRGRAGRRARRRARAPRRQAGQRPAQRRPRLPGRLRADALRRRRHAADDRRALPRHGRLHGAGAVPSRARTTRARTSTRSAACCSRRSPARRRSCARRCRRRCSRTCTTRRRGRRTRPACRAELRPRAGAGAGQGAGGSLPVGGGLRPRGAGRRRGALGHRGGALGGARRRGADDPPRRPPVVGRSDAGAATGAGARRAGADPHLPRAAPALAVAWAAGVS